MSAQKSAAPRLYRPPARVAFWRFVARHKWTAAAVALAMPAAVAVIGSGGCSGADDEETEVTLAANMPPPPAASVPLEDPAVAPTASASASAKPKGPAPDPTGLKLCCDALRNNAKTAPDDQKEAISRAADVCESVRNSPQARPGLVAVRGILKGANMPAECK